MVIVQLPVAEPHHALGVGVGRA
eukprot:COSAG05_NODE_21224_length_273_cov_0.896552_1_plen_22_part_10